ncbi:Tudor domain-containing protein [Aphelenchoides besseyi]|nr:Tudor domain-containing protein [Aphelenchoides besseyi]
MRLRVKYRNERRVFEDVEGWTIDDLKVFAADAFKIINSNHVQFFLGEKCISDDPASQLKSHGVVSGDLIVMQTAELQMQSSNESANSAIDLSRLFDIFTSELSKLQLIKSKSYVVHEDALETEIGHFESAGKPWRMRVECNTFFDTNNSISAVRLASVFVNAQLAQNVGQIVFDQKSKMSEISDYVLELKEKIFGPDNPFLRAFFSGSLDLAVKLFKMMEFDDVIAMRKTCKLVYQKSNSEFFDVQFWKQALKNLYPDNAVGINTSEKGAYRRTLMRNLRRSDREAFAANIRLQCQAHFDRINERTQDPLTDRRFYRPRHLPEPPNVFDDNFQRGEIVRPRNPYAPDRNQPDWRPIGPGHRQPPNWDPFGGGNREMTSEDHRPHPATRAMRDSSVCVKKQVKSGKRKMFELVSVPAAADTIHRVFLNCDTKVHVVNVVSPSCIWLKVFHHKTDNFDVGVDEQPQMKPVVQYDENNHVIKESLPKQYFYYLAPRMKQSITDTDSNVVYSRARLLEKMKKLGSKHTWCYMHFIDYGDGAWMSAECLAELPKDLWSHPWQTIPVSLFGLFPYADDHFELTALVDAEEVEAEEANKNAAETDERLAQDRKENAQEDALLEPSNQEDIQLNIEVKEMKIETAFVTECLKVGERVEHNRDIDESTQQPLFGRPTFVIPAHPREIVETWRLKFPEFPKDQEEEPEDTDVIEDENDRNMRLAGLPDDETGTEDDPVGLRSQREKRQLLKWDLEIENCETYTHQIPQLNMEMLLKKKLISKDGNMLIALNSRNRKSPYDFYGHFVKREENIDPYESLLKFYDEYIEWQNQLNSFYYLNGNCHLLEKRSIDEEVIREDGGFIYGIYGVPDSLERLNYMRVQVIGFNTSTSYDQVKDYCWIRFIDCGGMQIVPRYTILRLHSKFARQPPMGVQFCLSEILPKVSAKLDPDEYIDSWTNAQCDYFTELARTDTLMNCTYVDIIKIQETLGYMKAPHKLPDVVYIKNLRIVNAGLNETIEQKMIARGQAYRGNLLTN